MPLVDLLCEEEDKKNEALTADYSIGNQTIIESIRMSSVEIKRRILSCLEHWILKESIKLSTGNVSIIIDAEGNKVVVINDLRFKRSKKVEWNTVENYFKEYIGDCAEILDTNEMVYIGSDFPDEYAHSKDTKVLRGPNEYAKANASVAIKELIQIATDKAFTKRIIKISIIARLNMDGIVTILGLLFQSMIMMVNWWNIIFSREDL